MTEIVVTGANGFIGSALCPALRDAGYCVRKVVRTLGEDRDGAVSVGNIGPDTDWSRALRGVDVVVHLAARVHVMDDTSADPLMEYRKVNAFGTERLSRAAALSGVKRFIYLSSIKVCGECAEDTAPQEPYALSKWEAEQALHQVGIDTGLDVVIIRPPLVYGPGVKANFLKLMQWVDRGIPLPVASVNNRRSFLALDNLVDFLVHCISSPDAAGMTFHVSDGEDLSTPELIRRLAGHMGSRARLVSFPVTLLRIAAQLFGKKAIIERLCGSLVVDNCDARRLLNWSAPLTVDEGLARLAHWYRSEFVDGNI